MAEVPASARRVLILAPGGGNAAVARQVLTKAGLECGVCTDLTTLGRAIEAGAGAVLITAEALTPPALEILQRLLSMRPSWSALPLIILNGGRGRAEAPGLRDTARHAASRLSSARLRFTPHR